MKESFVLRDKYVNNKSPLKLFVDKYDTSTDVKFHSHMFYEFVYVEKGFLVHFFNNISCLLIPGDLFWVRPRDIHGYARPNNAIIYNCIFSSEVIENEKENILKLPGIRSIFTNKFPSIWQCIHLEPKEREKIVDCFGNIKIEQQLKKPGWELKVKSELYNFLVIVGRNYHLKNSGIEQSEEDINNHSFNEYIYKALSYIHSNYSECISVKSMADYVGLSYDYFFKLFKTLTGVAPLNYLKNVRISKALELLKDSSLTITDVSLKVGIDNSSYFSKMFKQVMGINPQQYQDTLNKQNV